MNRKEKHQIQLVAPPGVGVKERAADREHQLYIGFMYHVLFLKLVMSIWMLTPFFKNLIYMSEIFHLKFKKSQVTDFTSTRNHFPLQWKRQIFPQKGNETKYSEVMCCKTETHDTYYSQQRARCYTMRKTPLWHRQTASPVRDQTFGEVCATVDAAHVQGL